MRGDSTIPMKIAVYTCITGGYDPLRTPAYVDGRLDYYYFGDSPSDLLEPWKFRPVGLPHLDAKDRNRYIKMHPHKVLPEYDVTLYIDGSIRIVGDVYEMVTEALQTKGDIYLYDHLERNCIYSEAAICAHNSYEWVWSIARQMRRYSREGYPLNNGLFEGGVILRRNTDRAIKTLECWWKEYSRGVKRDQLSLTYVLWKLGCSVTSLGISDHRRTHKYFVFVNHKHRMTLSLLARVLVNRMVEAIVPYDRLFSTRRLAGK